MLNFAPHSPRAARKNYNAVPDRPPAEAGARRPRRPGHEIRYHEGERTQGAGAEIESRFPGTPAFSKHQVSALLHYFVSSIAYSKLASNAKTTISNSTHREDARVAYFRPII